MQNKPQLSAEMDKRFDDKFHCGQLGCNCADGVGSIVAVKQFLAIALEEQRAGFISQVEAMDRELDHYEDNFIVKQDDVLAILNRKDV